MNRILKGTQFSLLFIAILLTNCQIEDPVPISQLNVNFSKWLFGHNTALSFTWDDCNPSHYKIIYPLFKERNLFCSFFVNTNSIKDYNKGYKNMALEGFEIGSHTHNHKDISILDNDDLVFELSESQKTINNLIGEIPKSFVHPFNNTSIESDKLVFDYYLFSRWSPKWLSDKREIITLVENTTLVSLINLVKQNNSSRWLILAGHGVDGLGYRPLNSKELKSFLDYLVFHRKDIWIDKFEKIALFEEIREFVKITSASEGLIVIDDTNLRTVRYSEFGIESIPITIEISNSLKYTFYGSNILDVSFKNNNYYVTIDLAVNNIINYHLGE